MGLGELFLVAVGLSMDAFAVAICKGLAAGQIRIGHMLITGVWFGGFQALMPVLGYCLGSVFGAYITSFDHWIAFILLAFIGGNMIKEAFQAEEEPANASFSFRPMLLMAIATSIDALAVGVTFALLPAVNIWLAVGLIGIVTFLLSAIGVKIGSVFGSRYKAKAQLTGGIILLLIGLKILLEHLGVLP